MRPSASKEAGIVQIVRELKGDMKLSITISSRPRFVASDLRRGVGQSFVDLLLAIKWLKSTLFEWFWQYHFARGVIGRKNAYKANQGIYSANELENNESQQFYNKHNNLLVLLVYYCVLPTSSIKVLLVVL
jgi:hypothetical protein